MGGAPISWKGSNASSLVEWSRGVKVDRLQRSHWVIVARRNWLRKTSIEVLPAKTTRAILADASAPGSRVPPPNVACQRTSDELHGLLVHTQDGYLRIIGSPIHVQNIFTYARQIPRWPVAARPTRTLRSLGNMVTAFIILHMENDFADIQAKCFTETLKGHGRVADWNLDYLAKVLGIPVL